MADVDSEPPGTTQQPAAAAAPFGWWPGGRGVGARGAPTTMLDLWAACCSICCACVIITLLITYFIWAVITIFTTFESTGTACGASYNIWAFCLCVVLIIPILGCLTSVVANITALPGLMAVPPVINLAMAVWGMALWIQMGDTCMLALESRFWDLVLLFKINVILLSISFVVFLCIICLGAAFLGAVASGSLGGADGAGYTSLLGGRGGAAGAQGSGYLFMGRSADGDQGTDEDKKLRAAAKSGNLTGVEKLLRDGASVSRKGKGGWQPLHHAAANGHSEIVLKLVQAGANMDAMTDAGETPVQLSVAHPSVHTLLRSFGASTTTTDATAATQAAPSSRPLQPEGHAGELRA